MPDTRTGPFALVAALWMFLLAVSVMAAEADTPVKVKVAFLANRGSAEGLQRWKPTTDYLTASIPGYTFEAVPLDFDAVIEAVKNRQVDFVVANSGMYVHMEVEFGIARVATLKNMRNGTVCKSFGGVIFTRANRTDIQSLADLKGKSFRAVDEDSLGGWQMAWRELKAQGIDPYHDFSSLSFAGTHDKVVYEVRDGKFDAGTVRTDLFERVSAEGKIDLSSFRILNPQPATADFPFLRSTRLYPEWPFSKLKHTDDKLAQLVSIALLKMPGDHPAAKSAECVGWTVPLDYTDVHYCLQEIGVPPYREYGKVTLGQIFRQYWPWLLLGLVALAGLISAVAYFRRLNRNLTRLQSSLENELAERKRVEVSLQQARGELEQRVQERTADLAKANEGLTREIEGRKRIETERSMLSAIVENTTDIVGMTNPEQATLYLNSAARKLLGYGLNEDLSHKRIPSYHPPWAQKVIAESAIPTALKEGIWIGESAFLTREGREIPVSQLFIVHRDANGEVDFFSTIARDLSERQKLEEQLRQSQKMEAIGQLAGGVAHDFNNLLSIILGCAEIMEQRDPGRGDLKQDLDIVRRAVDRGASMTRQLLTFSRRLPLMPRVLDFNVVIQGMEPVLRRALGEQFIFQLKLAKNLKSLRADQSQLEQVLLNLCINARDAMQPGGKLEIETDVVHIQESDAHLPSGDYVRLQVRDTGCGMDAQTRARIFEPFFTTKEQGKGTGLGLSTVYGIVKQFGGSITLDSTPGKGTTFQVLLPGLDTPPEIPQTSSSAELKAIRGTILIAEDEEPVRNVLGRYLSLKGYNVLEASDGESALERAGHFNGTIDLLVTDMVMPGMQGHELARRLLEKRPGLKVLFVSGYMPDQAVRDQMLQTGAPFLQKPFSPEALVGRIKELLNGKS